MLVEPTAGSSPLDGPDTLARYEVEARPDGTFWVVHVLTRVIAILDGVGQIGLDKQAACAAVAVLDVTGPTGPSAVLALPSERCADLRSGS